MSIPRNREVVQPTEDVCGSVKQESSVMFKAVTRHGDAVEFTAAEARAVAEALLQLAARLESLG